MTPLDYVLYVVAALNLVLGGIVLFYGFKKKPNQFFVLIAFLLALWSILHAFSFTANNEDMILFWTQMIMLPGVLLPYSFLRFSQELAGSKDQRRVVCSLCHFVVIGCFLFCLFNNKLIASAELAAWGVSWTPGPLFAFYATYFAVTMGQGLWILVRKIMDTEGQKKIQLIYVFFGALVSIGSGFIVSIIHPIMGITTFNKYGPLGTVFLVSFLAYSILKHRLMDIRILVRRAALLIGVYGLLILVGSGIIYVVHIYRLGSSPQITVTVLFEALALAVTLSLGPFLYAYLIKRSSFFHEHEMAGITHDLKSPLGSIQGALELLDNLTEGSAVRDKDVEYVHMIRRNAARLEEAINNLLTVFQIPTKADAFEFKIHDMGEILKSVVGKFRDGVEAKGLKMDIATPNRGLIIRCDKTKIQQVISNLLANAVKYTKTGGILITLEERESDIYVSVRDSGEGIPPTELPRVFDRLFQGETSRKLKGSGLGLTIAKTWIEAHGGEIHAESDGVGKGSRLWFTLPK